jgi:hypothetical protein
LDPQTAPWNRVVQAYSLPDLLNTFERERPQCQTLDDVAQWLAAHQPSPEERT